MISSSTTSMRSLPQDFVIALRGCRPEAPCESAPAGSSHLPTGTLPSNPPTGGLQRPKGTIPERMECSCRNAGQKSLRPWRSRGGTPRLHWFLWETGERRSARPLPISVWLLCHRQKARRRVSCLGLAIPAREEHRNPRPGAPETRRGFFFLERHLRIVSFVG